METYLITVSRNFDKGQSVVYLYIGDSVGAMDFSKTLAKSVGWIEKECDDEIEATNGFDDYIVRIFEVPSGGSIIVTDSFVYKKNS